MQIDPSISNPAYQTSWGNAKLDGKKAFRDVMAQRLKNKMTGKQNKDSGSLAVQMAEQQYDRK